MATSSLSLVADLELEKAILSRVFMFLNLQRFGTIQEDDREKLTFAVTSLHSDALSYFSYSLYSDIFDFIYTQFLNNRFPDPWEITKHLQGKEEYKSAQNNVTQAVKDIVSYADFSILSLDNTPIEELVARLITINQHRVLNSKIRQGIKSEADIEEVKKLLENFDQHSTIKDRISEDIVKYRATNDPIDKVLAKKSLRMKGLIPQEVSDLTDNFIPPRPAPIITTGLDFLTKTFSASNWIYPGLVKAGVVNLVCGQAGSGKTLFCLAAMMSFLDNRPFLSESPSTLAKNPQNRGLFINADQPAVDCQEMLKANPLAWKLARLDKFHLIESDWCLADILHLEMLLMQGIYNFVVIDSYKAIHNHVPDWDENKAQASLGIKELQRLCEKYNTTILLIHHAGNEQQKGRHASRGHSSIADTASSVLSLKAATVDDKQNGGNPNIRFLDITKMRNSERANLILAFDPLTFSYNLMTNDHGIQRQKINTVADKILREFYQPGVTRLSYDALLPKVVTTGDKLDKRTFLSKVLQKLEQRGVITKEVDDCNSDLFLYKLSDPSEMVPAPKPPQPKTKRRDDDDYLDLSDIDF